jgi:hypothetical protein
MVMPWPRFPGLNGLKLQFHCVPCSLEIVSVPLGAAAEGVLDADVDAAGDVAVDVADDVGDEEGDEEDDEQAAIEAASSAAPPIMNRRLIPVVLH